MFILYNVLLIILWPFAAIYMAWRHYKLGKSAAPWRGRVPPEVRKPSKSTFPRFWLHAVSVGEVMAARPVARALKSTFKDCEIVVSTTTETGQNTAQQGVKKGEFDAVFYYPVDFAWTVNRVLNVVHPDVILLMETELWPNFLHLAHRRGIKIFQVNGRVSDNLLHQSRRWHIVWQWMIGNITAIFVRSEFDAKRLIQLGVDPSKVLLTGDVKLDGVNFNANRAEERHEIRQVLGIGTNELLWIGGSTHDGEEEILLQVQQKAQKEWSLRLMIAPRHPERVEAILELVRKYGFEAVRRSQLTGNTLPKNTIIILDTVGELARLYAAADIAFVGGSLIPRGGHNVLEPVLAGIPVLFGTHMQNFRAAAELVQNAKVGQCVNSVDGLSAALHDWLNDVNKRTQVAENATIMLANHQGATQRVAKGIAQYL